MTRVLSSATFLPQLLVTSNLPDVDLLHSWLTEQFDLPTTQAVEWLNNGETPPSIDQVRELLMSTSYSVDPGQVRVIGLAKLDQASIPAQNALLKLLEEPPVRTLLLLTTANPTLVLPTIHSRCRLITWSQTTAMSPEKESKTDQLPPADLYQTLRTAPAWQSIELAGQYPDRETAVAALHTLVTYVHGLPPTRLTTQHQQVLLQAYQNLMANGNVKLVLEQAFFQLSQTTST